MKFFIHLFSRIGFWPYIFYFTTIAIVVSELLIILQSYWLTGDFFDTKLLIVGFITPAVDGFLVSLLSALVLKYIINLQEESETVLDTTQDGFLIIDKKGTILNINNGYLNMSGYSKADLIGKNISFIQADMNTHECNNNIKAIKKLGYINFETRHIKKDGTTFYVDSSVSYSKNENEHLYIIVRDISEKKEVQLQIESQLKMIEQKVQERTKELQLQKESFETLFEYSRDGLVLIQDGKFIQCNKAVLDILGYTSKDDFLQLGPSDISPEFQPDGQSSELKANKLMQECLKNSYCEFEWLHKKQDGSNLWCKIALNKIVFNDIDTIYVRWRDIQREKELEVENKQYLETVQSIIVALDKEGNISLINPAGSKILGYENEELIGKNWFQTCLPEPEGVESVLPYFKDIINGNKESLKYHENHIVTKDKKQLYIAWQNAVLTDDSGKITGILSSGMDITEQRNIQLELIEAKERAEEATKTKSYFLANMSHEIRTPMNGIIGMSYLALETELNDKQKNYINKIQSSAKTLLNIINDILDISKIEAGKLIIEKENFNLLKVVENIIHILELKANEKHIDIFTEYDNKIGSNFYGDSLRINQILMNLLSNAIKFTHKGKITLVIKAALKNHIRFEVHDTGIGLTQEQKEHIFDSFTQADATTTKEYGGTGLGLTITKELIEMMNGKIWIEGELGLGSRFIFEIELPKENKEQPFVITNDKTLKQKSDLKNEIKTLKNSKILLAEDNQINQEFMRDLLKKDGIEIDIVANGLEAVNKVKQNNYELIIMDIQMPVMDGYEATRNIRETNKEIPIIALTANAMKEDVEKSNLAGMNEHISKPIVVEELYKILLKYLTKKTDIEGKMMNNTDNIFNIEIPKFETLDKDYALELVLGDTDILIALLKGMLQYKDLDFEAMNEDEFKRTMHTLKGLCGSIGALDVSDLAKDIQENENKIMLPVFIYKFNKVLDEIELKLPELKDTSFDTSDAEVLSIKDLKKQIQQLLNLILESDVSAIDTLHNIKQSLSHYGFKDKTKSLENHIDSFEFEEAVNILNEIDLNI